MCNRRGDDHGFSANLQRLDPYKNFKFRLKWDGRYVAGVSMVSALKSCSEVMEYREGGDPSSSRRLLGRTKHKSITLKCGATLDLEFENWAHGVSNFGSFLGSEVLLEHLRKDIILETYNEAGHLALTYKIHRCWVSEFQAAADLDANANVVAIEHIKLENEGWERDFGMTKPSEPPL